MAMGRIEHDRAIEQALLELAEAIGLDPRGLPGLEAIARQFRDRLVAEQAYAREAEREAEDRRRDYALQQEGWAAQEALDLERYGPRDHFGRRQPVPAPRLTRR